jgi:hypothetical protein
MKYTNLEVAISERTFSWEGFCFPDIICPSIHKGELAQSHHFFQSSLGMTTSLKINLKEAAKACEPVFADAQKTCSVDNDKFPYEQSQAQWWSYCLAPHSYLPLSNGQIQIGLNFFDRFLHLDYHSRCVQLIDPEVGNQMLSTTNWYDQKAGELWFASWPVKDTVQRMINPRKNVRVTIWKHSIINNDSRKVWQGNFADSVHQLIISPDRHFLILTELGLRPEEPAFRGAPDQTSSEWKGRRGKGVIPSETLILNLKTGEEWRLPILAAGHMEFDPDDEDVFYLSSHNIGLIGVKVGIFGTGAIKKIRLKDTGPELIGEFSHPDFHRITTHIVFRHRGKVLIGVSGYPSTMFLIDAVTMKLYKTIKLDPGEKVDTTKAPHICRQDSYGIASSQDGEAILAVGTGFVNAAFIEEGMVSFKAETESFAPDSCFTGHLGVF